MDHALGRTLSTLAVVLALAAGSAVAQSTPPPVVITDLGSLGGTRGINVVNALNNQGTVVGALQGETGYHAYVWNSQGYRDLGTVNGGTSSVANSVNDLGQVAGSATDSVGQSHAVLWAASGAVTDLGIGPNGYGATAKVVNSKGWVAGEFDSYAAPSGRHAFFWSPSTGLKDLGTLGGSYLVVTGMNSDGVVVGYGQTAASPYRAFASKAKSGPLKDLGTLGGSNSYAYAINDNGKITGAADTTASSQHAFYYSNNKMTDIGTLGYSSYGTAISSANTVVGQIDLGGTRHAFVWTGTGGMVDIGTLGGGDSRATGVNAAGRVTGVSGAPDQHDHAFLWTSGAGMADLGSSDDLSSIGLAINSAGQVAGTYQNRNNDQKAFFWDPAAGRTNIVDKGWTQSSAVAVSGAGMVVGSSLNPAGYTRAFTWTAAGGMVEIYTPTGNNSAAVDVNNAGQVIGNHGPPNEYTQGFLWSSSTGFVPVTAGGYTTTLVAINQAGQIIGYGVNPSYQNTAFLRQPDGTMLTMAPPLGGDAVQPIALNDSGIVVGQYLQNGSYHAFRWSPAAAGITDLGAITAVAINATGEVTGSYTLSDGRVHAYLQKTTGPRKDLGELNSSNYSAGIAINASAQVAGDSGGDGFFYDNKMRDMGSLGNGGFALALNDAGVAVGWSYTALGQQHGFSWAKATGIRDLGTLGGASSKAVKINPLGRAVGESSLADGSVHAVLWIIP